MIDDPFRKIYDEARRDQQRIRGDQPTPAKTHAELHGTVMQYILDLTQSVAQLKEGTANLVGRMEERLAFVEEVTGDMVDSESETRISAQDAVIFSDLIEACQALCDQLLPDVQDPKAKKLFEELRKLATQCQFIVDEALIEEDEDDDDEDEYDEPIGQA